MLSSASQEADERLAERQKARTRSAENFEIVRDVYNRAKALRSFVDGMEKPVSARTEIIERLKSGDALPKEFAKDAELERLKSRVQNREEADRTAALARIERATSKVKDVSAELRKSDPKGGAGDAQPSIFDRIRDKSAELRNSAANATDRSRNRDQDRGGPTR